MQINCSKCGKLFDRWLPKRRVCRKCYSKSQIAWRQRTGFYQRNKERHGEKIAAQRHRYYVKNKAVIREKQKQYDKAHRAERLAYWNRYYRENKKERIAYIQQWRKDNLEKVRGYGRDCQRRTRFELREPYVRKILRDIGIPNPTKEQISKQRQHIRNIRKRNSALRSKQVFAVLNALAGIKSYGSGKHD